MDEFIDIKNELPEKGKDIIGVTSDGDIKYCFRCNCHVHNCKDWRDSTTGFGLIVNIIKWKYIK